ncbi:MAG: DUF1996 domain-containing protein [Terriglobus roseus]|nr:DUF1996 domain-containing protein [Terriglobus roseus]
MQYRILSVATAALVGSADAFWRMPCHGRTGLARIDPIVDPGEVSGHAHAIHGGSGFGMGATYEDLINSDCTSCGVYQDKSAYWTPPLLFQFPNGTTEVVPQVGGMLAYYLLYGDNITAFPENFRMIAGDNFQRNFTWPVPDPPKSNWDADMESQFSLMQHGLGFNCLNYARAPEPSLYRHFLPTKDYLDANCADGIRLELMFPSCWNGNDTDSKDHKSHMAYPSQVMDGECPEGFETRVPSLFFETIWNTAAYNGVAGSFVLSNGDPTGKFTGTQGVSLQS